MTAPLPALMEVLDRADALTRDQLLASAKALGTDHTPAVLEAAVDAYLKHPPLVPPAARSFRFPWRRPTSNQALQTRLRRTRWLAWWFGGDARAADGGKAALHSVVLGAMIAIVLDLFMPSGHIVSQIFLAMLGGFLLGSFGLFPISLLAYIGLRKKWVTDQGMLSHPIEAYVSHGPTRAYLQAVLASPVPDLLQGDMEWLNKTMDHYLKIQAAQGAQRAAQEARIQQVKSLTQAVSEASR